MGNRIQELAARLDWEMWDRLIADHGITIDRPKYSAHPVHADIIYPVDYGFVNGTVGNDGDEIDVFLGSADNGLVALILTRDYRKGDSETKLIYNCTPAEIYIVNGFINYDRTLMEGWLATRNRMREMWDISS